MRISDLSSDVCSSDLAQGYLTHNLHLARGEGFEPLDVHPNKARLRALDNVQFDASCHRIEHGLFAHRLSEERSEEHTSELQSLMRTSYAVLCLNKKS